MIKLFLFLITGCWHKWEIHDTTIVYDPLDGESRQIATNYILRCTKCNDFKKRTI